MLLTGSSGGGKSTIALALPQETSGLMLITVHPDRVAPQVLSLIDTIMVDG